MIQTVIRRTPPSSYRRIKYFPSLPHGNLTRYGVHRDNHQSKYSLISDAGRYRWQFMISRLDIKEMS